MRNGNLNYEYKSVVIQNVCSIYDKEILDNSIIYLKNADKNILQKLTNIKSSIIILPKEIDFKFDKSNYILNVENPRLEFAKHMIEAEKVNEKNKKIYIQIPNTLGSFCGINTQIGDGTIIEPSVFIEDGVKIGKNCLIKSGARIHRNVKIGNDTVIKSNSVIGDSGFGVETDKNGKTYKIPHVGGVEIGSHVEIGALTTVCSGTIHPTRIGDYTKIDDHVHIGHNVQIDESVIITACSEISRSQIGRRVWVGPNSSIIQGVTLGEECFVGIGSVVTKSINPGQIVAGNPAQDINDLKKLRKKMKELLNE